MRAFRDVQLWLSLMLPCLGLGCGAIAGGDHREQDQPEGGGTSWRSVLRTWGYE